MTKVLNLDALRAAPVSTEPYTYLFGEGVVKREALDPIAATFPNFRNSGFHPLDDVEVKGAFGDLIDDVQSDEFVGVLSEKFGYDYRPLPQLITVRKVSAAHEGRIHCDGEKKIMSFLVYLNDAWDSPEGRFRVLYNDKDFTKYAAEVPPVSGAFVAFKRADHSWHGHTPFVGERRVVQVAFLRDQAAVDRKKGTHKLSSFFKNLRAKAS
jgi:SM-20-related protein